MKVLVLLSAVFLTASVSAGVEYEKIAEANSARIGNVVARYLRSYSSPCLDVQILAPDDGWKIIAQKNFCEFNGGNFSTDFTYAGFEEVSIKQDGVHLTLSIFPLEPTVEESRKCFISIKHSSIGMLTCSAPITPSGN
jgi:hypothetical protein